MLLPFAGTDAANSTAITLANVWLFLHLLLPCAPYGSLAARGRTDPRGSWSMPAWYPFCCQALFVLTRLAIALDAVSTGNTWLAAAFALPAALALVPATALAGWSISFGIETFLVLGGEGSLAAVLLLHLLTFQPAWIPRRPGAAHATVFYDGACALCHSAVRFLIAEDVEPARFRIAPLEGPTFVAQVPERVRVTRPDSIVVVREGEVLLRAGAVIAILEALGGLWWMTSAFLRLLPRGFLDAAYDAVAARRYRWFGKRSDSCPLLPAALAGRIER